MPNIDMTIASIRGRVDAADKAYGSTGAVALFVHQVKALLVAHDEWKARALELQGEPAAMAAAMLEMQEEIEKLKKGLVVQDFIVVMEVIKKGSRGIYMESMRTVSASGPLAARDFAKNQYEEQGFLTRGYSVYDDRTSKLLLGGGMKTDARMLEQFEKQKGGS